MITYTTGNLLDSGCGILVNTVNCQGVMGKGLALDFKKRYPDMYESYKEACRLKLVRPGHVYLGTIRPPYILNFATKDHWRDPSRYEWIAFGLGMLHSLIEALPANSAAIPALGCGNGGLDWARVKPMIEFALSAIKKDITVYKPHDD